MSDRYEEEIRYFLKEAEVVFDHVKLEEIKQKSKQLYTQLVGKYAGLSKAEGRHVYDAILPTIAFYKTVQRYDNDLAMKFVEEGAKKRATRQGEILSKIVRLPGMGYGFVGICKKMTPNMFGIDAGFAFDVVASEKGRFKFNMLQCPYVRYCKAEGCYELTHIFCDNDVYSQGNLPKVALNRSQTLGTGGECCDFEYIIRGKR